MLSRRKLAALGIFVAFLCLPCAAQEDRWKQLNDQVKQLSAQRRYAEAIPIAQEAVRVAESTFGPEHMNTAPSLSNLAGLYSAQGRYAEAEPLLQRALTILEKALGPEDRNVATVLIKLALLCQNQGRYAEAEPLYQRALRIREKALGLEHADVVDSLNSLALLYEAQGRYGEAEPLLQRALRIDEKALGPEHPDVATVVSNLAGLYREQGNYAGAEPLYQRSLRILEKALGPEHPNVTASLNNLAVLYMEQGRYAEAEPLYQRSLGILQKTLGPEHPDVATSLNNLAVLYYNQGRYGEAEPLFQRALRIDEKVLGPEHPAVAGDLNNLAELYREQGRYAEAEPLYQRALHIREKALGPDHSHVAISLGNLAELYRALGKYTEAEPLYRRALAIFEKTLGPEHAYVAVSLGRLAELYRAQGRYAEAEPLYQRALRILEKALGPEHPYVAASLGSLGALYDDQARYPEAEPLLRRALRIYEKALGPEHPGVARALSNLAGLQFSQGKAEAAQPLFARELEIFFHRFQYNFTYMSEQERLQYLQTVSGQFPLYFSFCTTYAAKMPALTGSIYDVLLWEKGFVGQSIAALRAKIAASGDPEALKLLDQLTALKQQLSVLLNKPGADRAAWQKQVSELQAQADQVEQELVRRSAVLREDKKLERVTWRDVQKALKPGEAAVEMVKFQFYDGKKWTDTYKYVALLVTPETTTAPTLVMLGESKDLEAEPLKDYQQLVQEQAPPEGGGSPSPSAAASASSVKFYAAFWQPLAKPLAGAKRVYLSPDGVLNQISWAVISSPGGKALSERYDLRLVSSTKDLLRQPRAAGSQSAVLVGNPKFEMEDAEQDAAVRGVVPAEPVLVASASVGPGLRSRDPMRGALTPLPGTKVEVESVAKLLQASGWHTETYTEARALEEAVKQVRQPRLLHLATHGFFLPDQQVKRRAEMLGVEKTPTMDDPMLRSGLFLAGAERTVVENNPPADLEDGVLTAYEATQLNLQGTELVVLSACETGLGKVEAGEGVFGLRRALEIAGAQSVMMTMWSVPDRETQELMSLFYQKWLAGKDKHQALREAQQEMRAKVKARYGRDLPFYWGAFVLVGR